MPRFADILGVSAIALAATPVSAAPPPASPPVASTWFTTADGAQLHVFEGGSQDDGPVIAFVPGWSMPAAIWHMQLAALGTRHRVAALDPRGQGRSEVPADGYDIDRRADDLGEFVARYACVVLVGWSLGALEALHYVHRHGAGRLAGLVLVDSSVGEDPPPPAGGFLDELKDDRPATMERFVRGMFQTPRAEEEITALTEAALRMPLEASLALFPRAYPRAHWRGIARAFPGPLLYVVTPQFAAQAQALQQARPATRIQVFEHAGHALFADEPERFSRLIAEFVGSLGEDAASACPGSR